MEKRFIVKDLESNDLPYLCEDNTWSNTPSDAYLFTNEGAAWLAALTNEYSYLTVICLTIPKV